MPKYSLKDIAHFAPMWTVNTC